MSSVAGSLVYRNYSSFRGVDFSQRKDEISLYRSPDSLNMWKNYKNSNGNCIETRPDLDYVKEYESKIYGMHFYNNNLIVHSETKLYDDTKLIYSSMAASKSCFFVFNKNLYIKDGTNYLVYDGSTIKNVETDAYIPTTTISKYPSGGGKKYEDVNLLSPYRKNSFCADGESKDYYLDVESFDSSYTPKVWVNNVLLSTSKYSYAASSGKITFVTAPEEPDTVGTDNVVIQFRKSVSGYADRIKKCTMLEVFDNRVFFAGNPDYPNILWHCSLEDPSYCSDLDYYSEGVDDAKIQDLVSGNNALWVFKEPSQSNTTIFYHLPTIDSEYGKIYPSTHSSISTGCVGKAINFNDTICFFSDIGMEGISGDITTEQVITHKSTLVDNKLLNETNYKNMILEKWQGYLLVIIDKKVYLADSRAISTNINHTEYEWFYWEFDKKITNCIVKDEILYLCSNDTIYTLTNSSSNIKSYWTTLEDECNYPQMMKVTNKKGCVVDLNAETLNLYARTDKTQFELINKYKKVLYKIVPKIKRKKWKAIQLKFESDTRFSLYSCTLECYVTNYLKK